MATYTFIINDENEVNSYGFRVMTSGIRLKTFRTNPLVLWMHKRPSQWRGENDKDNEVFPIGKAVKVWAEGGLLKAEIEFDQEDDFAKKIEQKVASGIIRMSSMGFDVISKSEDVKYLLPGQSRPTVTQSELIEISVVDIGANKKALKLYNDGHQELSIDTVLPEMKLSLNDNKTVMKKVIAKLNGFGLQLNEDANEEQIVAALDGVKLNDDKPNQKVVDQLISLGKKTGVITEGETGNEARFRKLAAADMDLFVDMLGIEKLSATEPKSKTPSTRLSEAVNELKDKKGTELAGEKDFAWYERNDPDALLKMEQLEPEKFAKLKAADDAKYES